MADSNYHKGGITMQPFRRMKRKGVAGEIMGMCVDCKRSCFLSDIFIVKNETWAEAGLNGWNAGYLHLSCLKKRLGRELNEGELLVWNVRGNKYAYLPEYVGSPEYLRGVNPPKGDVGSFRD
jgi:hypothetical protein